MYSDTIVENNDINIPKQTTTTTTTTTNYNNNNNETTPVRALRKVKKIKEKKSKNKTKTARNDLMERLEKERQLRNFKRPEIIENSEPPTSLPSRFSNNQSTAKPTVNSQIVPKQSNSDGGVPVHGTDQNSNNQSGSDTNKINTKNWSKKETDLFMEKLKIFGTDFTMLEIVVPGRTRQQLKLKFKKEQRDNPNLLNDIMMCNNVVYDIEDFKTQKVEADLQRKEKEVAKELKDQLNSSGSGIANRYQEEIVMDKAQYAKYEQQKAAQSMQYDSNDYYGGDDYYGSTDDYVGGGVDDYGGDGVDDYE